MTRMKQINIDASRLQGVDLSRVPNQKIKMPKGAPTRLSGFDSSLTKASISAAAAVNNGGKWAAIPQDFGNGFLSASMVVPTSTTAVVPTPTTAPGSSTRRPNTMAVTLGLTAVTLIGVNMSGGAYSQSRPSDFGLLGGIGLAGSTSLGVSGAIDLFMVDGGIDLLDGLGVVITVDVGVTKVAFSGLGIVCVLPSWNIVGFVVEFGAGWAVGPPVTLNIQLGYGGHVHLV
jgi:hypothetical protein